MDIITKKEAKEQGLKRYSTGKPCKHGHVAERRLSNGHCVECEIEHNKAWREANPDKVRESKKAYYAANSENVRARSKAWREANSDKERARSKERYWSDRDGVYGRLKAWHAAHPNRTRDSIKAWRAANPDKNKEYKHRRRARKLEAGGTFTADEYKSLLEAQGHRCAVCGADLRETGNHADHVVPLSKGGDNSILNIQALCPTCNLSKHDKDPIEFMNERGFLL